LHHKVGSGLSPNLTSLITDLLIMWHTYSLSSFRATSSWLWHSSLMGWMSLRGHGKLSQKMILFITTTVKTSNPTMLYYGYSLHNSWHKYTTSFPFTTCFGLMWPSSDTLGLTITYFCPCYSPYTGQCLHIGSALYVCPFYALFVAKYIAYGSGSQTFSVHGALSVSGFFHGTPEHRPT
jgi:hypothetical protein